MNCFVVADSKSLHRLLCVPGCLRGKPSQDGPAGIPAADRHADARWQHAGAVPAMRGCALRHRLPGEGYRLQRRLGAT